MRGLALAALLVAAGGQVADAACAPPRAWPAWEDFKRHFVSADGRVVDARQADARTTSEGQAYALFFALVAGDRPAFDRLHDWTRANLMAGGTAELPAWLWGRAADGAYRVLDANAASDADLWLSYALLEAGRRFERPALGAEGERLLAAMERRELRILPRLGPVLLPGPEGFLDERRLRLNPSYLFAPALRLAAARRDSAGTRDRWLGTASDRMWRALAPNGLVPDWVDRAPDGGPAPAGEAAPETRLGSYDAIRAYLWAGMAGGRGKRGSAAHRHRALAERVAATGIVPERIDVRTGAFEGQGPFGFSAALVPLLETLGRTEAAEAQALRAEAQRLESLSPAALAVAPPPYYDHALALFGLGFHERRFAFGPMGRLALAGDEACRPAAPSPSR